LLVFTLTNSKWHRLSLEANNKYVYWSRNSQRLQNPTAHYHHHNNRVRIINTGIYIYQLTENAWKVE